MRQLVEIGPNLIYKRTIFKINNPSQMINIFIHPKYEIIGLVGTFRLFEAGNRYFSNQ